MRSKHLVAALALLWAAWLIASIGTADAQLRRQDGAWVKLGEQTVSLGQDFDVVAVGRREGRFKAIKLVVRGNDVFMEDLKVTYGNGQSEDLVVRKRIPVNSESTAIDLQGEARFIEKIEMAYRARPGGGRATVEVYGLPQIDGQQRDDQTAGWREIDAQRVNLSANRVEMPVGREEGRHARIRLRALEEPLFVRKVTVVYGRGGTQELSFRGALEPGESSPPLDLDGDRARTISQVVVELRPQTRNRGIATLQLYGDNAGGTSYRPPVDDYAVARGGQVYNDIPKGWVLFGNKAADFTADRDVIVVGRQFGRFDKVAIRVRDNDVFIRDIRFVYGNGESDVAEIRQVIPANTRTREIQLKGDRFLERIELSYQSRQGGARRAQVEVYGAFANNWLGEQGEGQKYNQGWVLLGSQRATMFKTDTDSFAVGQQHGTFKKIQLTARRNKVDITGLKITYGNGETEDVPISGTLVEGGSSAVYDLARGRGRHIESIQLRYQSRLSLRGDGLVEVWGQH
jgi:hypothetical protein